MSTITLQLTPEQVKYLAELVDWDTTGNQDDELYLLLMKAWNEYSEDETEEE